MNIPNNRSLSLLSLLFFSCSIFFDCSQNKKAPNEFVEVMDQRTKTRFRQYMILGKRLYLQHCANCHGESGEGLEKLIPPLAESDYLMAEIDRSVCQIRYGVNGEIVVNGTLYNQEMPANQELRVLEIAEIVTFITNSWGNERGLISARQVEEFMSHCLQDATF